MDQKEFQLKNTQLHAGIEKWMVVKDIIILLSKMITIILCIWIIMYYVNEMSNKNAEAITAISKVVEKLSINNIILYIATAGSLGYGYLERRGKKRAIEKISYLQSQLEINDPYRGTSKLTRRGDTPKTRNRGA